MANGRELCLLWQQLDPWWLPELHASPAHRGTPSLKAPRWRRRANITISCYGTLFSSPCGFISFRLMTIWWCSMYLVLFPQASLSVYLYLSPCFSCPCNDLPPNHQQCTIYLAGSVPPPRVFALVFPFSPRYPAGLTHIVLTLPRLLCILHIWRYVVTECPIPTFGARGAPQAFPSSFTFLSSWRSHE